MSTNEADRHTNSCITMLDKRDLAGALAYCEAQRIDPPQCSLTADSPNANRLRAKAMEHLSDVKWWKKHLDILAKRDAWMAQMKQQPEGWEKHK